MGRRGYKTLRTRLDKTLVLRSVTGKLRVPGSGGYVPDSGIYRNLWVKSPENRGPLWGLVKSVHPQNRRGTLCQGSGVRPPWSPVTTSHANHYTEAGGMTAVAGRRRSGQLLDAFRTKGVYLRRGGVLSGDESVVRGSDRNGPDDVGCVGRRSDRRVVSDLLSSGL